MIVRWYAADKTAKIFCKNEGVAELIAPLDFPDLESVDKRLKLLGFRRCTKWKMTKWGWGAEVPIQKIIVKRK